jgi:hypothetical protein
MRRRLAVLVGAGATGLWQLRQRRPWLAFALLLAGVGITLAFQIFTAQAYTDNLWWLPPALGLFAGGLLLLAVGTARRLPLSAAAGFACVVLALLVMPGVWSGLTTFSPNVSQMLPAAYGGESSGPMGQRGRPSGLADQSGLQVDQVLLDSLEEHTQGMKYLMASPARRQAQATCSPPAARAVHGRVQRAGSGRQRR